MASRHEEKYIIDYRQYVMLKDRACQLMTPDPHGQNGSYVITSVYYDDFLDHALYEKLDGLPEHSKFRIRTYDYSDRVIKLERKDKTGILTHKLSASMTRDQIPKLCGVHTDLADFPGKLYDLAAQVRAADLRPVVAVRYTRDAFCFEGMDLRLTFDTNLSGEIMPSLTTIVRERQEKGLPSVLVRDYRLRLLKEGVTVWEKSVNGNGQRLNIHEVENVDADKLEVTVTATHGCKAARIYEIRIY